jgi:hypothetical protein
MRLHKILVLSTSPSHNAVSKSPSSLDITQFINLKNKARMSFFGDNYEEKTH